MSGSQLLWKMLACPQTLGLASVALGGGAMVCGDHHQLWGSAGQKPVC